jgi:hypothetical protein
MLSPLNTQSKYGGPKWRIKIDPGLAGFPRVGEDWLVVISTFDSIN